MLPPYRLARADTHITARLWSGSFYLSPDNDLFFSAQTLPRQLLVPPCHFGVSTQSWWYSHSATMPRKSKKKPATGTKTSTSGGRRIIPDTSADDAIVRNLRDSYQRLTDLIRRMPRSLMTPISATRPLNMQSPRPPLLAPDSLTVSMVTRQFHTLVTLVDDETS